VVGEPPEVFQVPVAEAVNCFEFVMDSKSTGLWAKSWTPVAPKPVPLNDQRSVLSCCGLNGPDVQVDGGVGMTDHPCRAIVSLARLTGVTNGTGVGSDHDVTNEKPGASTPGQSRDRSPPNAHSSP
jgi:hypothetical protein